jgi:hypothetical protein
MPLPTIISEPEQLAGKTVAKCFSNGAMPCLLVILFTDGTAAIPGVDFGYDGDYDIELEDSIEWDYQQLLSLGIITQEEFDAHNAELERRRIAADNLRRAEEYATYRRLKAKFDTEQGT